MTDVNRLGGQECGYIRTEEFDKDGILARVGLDLGAEPQVDGSSPTLGLKPPPHLSEPSTSDPSFPLFDATAQPSIEFDDMAYLAALDAPLPTNTGWEQLPPHINNVTEMSFIVPKVMWSLSWSEIPANEALNEQGSPTTELSTLLDYWGRDYFRHLLHQHSTLGIVECQIDPLPSHQVLPPQQAVHPSVFTRHRLVQSSFPLNESTVDSCGCASDVISKSCLQLQQHLEEASKSQNTSETCTCFERYRFLREYSIVAVVKTCCRIVDHLRDMVSPPYLLG